MYIFSSKLSYLANNNLTSKAYVKFWSQSDIVIAFIEKEITKKLENNNKFPLQKKDWVILFNFALNDNSSNDVLRFLKENDIVIFFFF